MSKVGQNLFQPENGWKRFDDMDTNFNYVGKWHGSNSASGVYLRTFHVGKDIGDSVLFNFTGTSLRIISDQYPGRATINVYIDGMLVGNYSLDGNLRNCILLFEKLNLRDKEHSCILKKVSGNDFLFDAIDITENRILKSYKELYKYLLKQNNQHYTIKNNELTLLENQNLNKSNFETNGFDDLSLLNSIDKTDMKLLVYDESNRDKLKLKYILKELFRPIDKFKGKIKILKQEMK